MRRVLILALTCAFSLVSFMSFAVQIPFKAQAYDMNNWDAGQIITDGNFWTSGKMTTAQIQTFLNTKNPACTSSGNNKCLKDYKETTITHDADAYCAKYQGASNESAAQIISKVSTACKVSEKALLVMLQKEQGLITALWGYYVDPNRVHGNDDSHYRSAMGMGCPDTAACDSKYYGFANQVYSGARQLNVY
ncbi:MAG: hypothetical protein LBB07_01980, partial [Bifidobacteriaceae bacterium]|nr:hypothetical protein [Bifidobacteriaceae bacterium]